MKATRILVIVAVAGLMLAGCKTDDKSVKVTKITLNKTETSIFIGESEQLSVTEVLPANATEKGVTWSSETTACATVDQTGKVTVPATATAGTVKITATAKDGSGVKGECTVTVEIRLEIGQQYQGGIIAYLDGTGKHGLIAAPSDQSTGIQWYNGSYITTNATGTAIGTGQSNTTAIVTAQGAGNYAAKLCDDLVLNSYSDWYLPSMDELNKLFVNKITAFGDYYWSSTEAGRDNAWYHATSDITAGGMGGKQNTLRVRAVRTF